MEKQISVKLNVEVGKIKFHVQDQTGDAKEEIFTTTEGQDLEADLIKILLRYVFRNIDDERSLY